MKVLICDDEKDRCAEMKKALLDAGRSDNEIVPLVGEALTGELKSLFKYVKDCLTDPASCRPTHAGSFDDIDLVIIDNNLTHLDIEGTRLTAESIAGYVRAFTAAPYVVSVNKNPDVDFDLRYLVGDYATRADLAVNTEHLSIPALWTGKRADAKDGFAPWYWPALSEVVAKRREQINVARAHLHDPIYATLEFPASAIDVLSRHAKGALSPFAQSDGDNGNGAVPFDKVSFCEFFLASGRSLPVKADRENLHTEERAGNTVVREIIARIVAADLDLWFRRDVSGPQEALVDVPHLLMRMPFLLGERAEDAEAWRAAAGTFEAPFGLKRDIFDQFLAPKRFKYDEIWVRSPCFWWPELRDEEKLNDLYDAEKAWADVVFCEDVSDFIARKPTDGASPKEFVTEFEGPWSRRHVHQLANFKYAPRSRFAL